MGTDGELGQMAGRLIGVAVGLTYAHLAQSDVTLVAQRLADVRLLAYGYLAYLLVASIAVIRHGAVSRTVRYANTFADVNAVTTALYLGDAQVAPGVIYYLWAMAGNGFRYGARYLYFGQILAIVGSWKTTRRTGSCCPAC
jgi:two-component system sensor histidine kinase RpfC